MMTFRAKKVKKRGREINRVSSPYFNHSAGHEPVLKKNWEVLHSLFFHVSCPSFLLQPQASYRGGLCMIAGSVGTGGAGGASYPTCIFVIDGALEGALEFVLEES
jgi:hypothetical protein